MPIWKVLSVTKMNLVNNASKKSSAIVIPKVMRRRTIAYIRKMNTIISFVGIAYIRTINLVFWTIRTIRTMRTIRTIRNGEGISQEVGKRFNGWIYKFLKDLRWMNVNECKMNMNKIKLFASFVIKKWVKFLWYENVYFHPIFYIGIQNYSCNY